MAIALAVPVFFLLMGLELGWNQLRLGRGGYTLQDTLNNLACGIGQQLIGLGLKGYTFAIYLLLYERIAQWHLPNTWPVFLLALLGADLCYYWFHRAGHRVNLFWAGHAVHHQSEEMNLSVALRQSWFVQSIAWVFYLPLALLGVPPELFVAANLTITLYQFWIHTETIGKLWAPIEWLFNTPSHHRAHHGTNPAYLDANYAGMFMLWDRAFGTFVPEEEEVVYGTVAPLRSWNPLWANLTYIAGFLRLAWGAERWRDRLWAPFAPPEWRPENLGGVVTAPPVSREAQEKYALPARLSTSLYAFAHFVPALTIGTLLLVHTNAIGPQVTIGVALWVFATLQSIGALFEQHPWSRAFELLRLVGTGALGAVLGGPWLIASVSVAATSALWLLLARVGVAPSADAVPTPAPEPAVAT